MLMVPTYGEIADRWVHEVFLRVAGLDVKPADPARWKSEPLKSLVATTRGDYQLTLALSIDEHTLHSIAAHMKRCDAPVAADEVMMYTLEFFNILCGRLVSAINQELHQSARFGIPEMKSDPLPPTGAKQSHAMRDRFYEDCHGLVLRLRATGAEQI